MGGQESDGEAVEGVYVEGLDMEGGTDMPNGWLSRLRGSEGMAGADE